MRIIKTFNWLKTYNLEQLIIEINDNFVTIYNSHKITKSKHMNDILNVVRKYFKLNDRNWLLICEWKTHNLLFKLNIKHVRTMHVDLDNKNTFFNKLCYVLLSFFYFS